MLLGMVCDDASHVHIQQQVFMVRILSEFGYIQSSDALLDILQASSLKRAIEAYTPTLDRLLTESIEQASQVSHL